MLITVVTLSMLISISNLHYAEAEPNTVYVDDDNSTGPWDGSSERPYQNITSGIERASSGDRIFVFNGTYYEHIIISKQVSLVGENPFNTVIDGEGREFSPIVHVFNTENVVFDGFTVQNTASGFGVGGAGVLIWQARNITVRNCVATKCYFGIQVGNSINCRFLNNILIDNHAYAIDFRIGSTNNSIINNLVANNPTGIYIEEASSQFNVFYRNNIVSNTNQATLFGGLNYWDNGAEGNYWDDYSGFDLNGDGIGDVSYFNIDGFPLMEPWNTIRTHPVDSSEIITICNYTIASVSFNELVREISFSITGPPGWSGFCNITIPKQILSLENASERWLIMLGSTPTAYLNESLDNSTLLSFRYIIGPSLSDNRVRIRVGVGYPPTADFQFSPSEPIATEMTVFNDVSVLGNGAIVWRHWSFGDGNIENSTQPTITHNYTDVGNFTVTLTITDSLGLADSCSKTARVIQYPSASFIFFPQSPLVNETVIFNASNSNPNGGRILAYEWSFGDSSNATRTEPTTSHTYVKNGTYEVSLTVVDSEGLNSTIIDLINILNLPVGTIINLHLPETIIQNQAFQISATLRETDGKPVSDRTIDFLLFNGSVWEGLGTAVTNQSGVAVLSHLPQMAGTYKLKTVFDGDESYARVESSELSFTVQTSEMDFTPLAVFAVIIVVVICLVFIAIKRKKRGS